MQRTSAKAVHRAFTLTELLVVVGLIALLIALLLPAMARARRSAYRVACGSNVRQLALANFLYLNESRDWYLPVKWGIDLTPPPGWPPRPPGLAPPTIATLNWVNNPAFRRNLNLPQFNAAGRVPGKWVCPLATLALSQGTAKGYPWARTYGYNAEGIGWYSNPTVYYTGLKRGEVRAGHRKLMFADAVGSAITRAGSTRYERYGEFWGLAPDTGQPVTGSTAYRHENGAMVAFFDGHVEWVHKRHIISQDGIWKMKQR